MTRKEINEIKSQFNIEDCGILKLCGCYVDGEKNKVTTINETFLNLPTAINSLTIFCLS